MQLAVRSAPVAAVCSQTGRHSRRQLTSSQASGVARRPLGPATSRRRHVAAPVAAAQVGTHGALERWTPLYSASHFLLGTDNCKGYQLPMRLGTSWVSSLPDRPLLRAGLLGAAQAEAPAAAAGPDLSGLKMALLDSFWDTQRGLKVSADLRAEISELINQVGAARPVPLPLRCTVNTAV